MLKHLIGRNTYQFYELYYMVWNREQTNNKFVFLVKNYYCPMFLVMKYIEYNDIYKTVIEQYFPMSYCVKYNQRTKERRMSIYEETIDISENALSGIKITYKNDPVNCLIKLKSNPEYNFVYSNTLSNIVRNNHVQCMQYYLDTSCTFFADAAFQFAAIYDSVRCLQYLHENGYIYAIKDRAPFLRAYSYETNIFDMAIDKWACCMRQIFV